MGFINQLITGKHHLVPSGDPTLLLKIDVLIGESSISIGHLYRGYLSLPEVISHHIPLYYSSVLHPTMSFKYPMLQYQYIYI